MNTDLRDGVYALEAVDGNDKMSVADDASTSPSSTSLSYFHRPNKRSPNSYPKKQYSLETNPTKRRKQKLRLIRKLREILDEYSMRIGEQAVIAIVNTDHEALNVFGSRPLQEVVKKFQDLIIDNLRSRVVESSFDLNGSDEINNNNKFELPPLIFNGIPTAVENMTQQQLRAFIPLMLKYSTGRGKPGWGKANMRPVWWPQDLPWANIRVDTRSEDVKNNMSWTHALRSIVRNCYKHHQREDLLPQFQPLLAKPKKNHVKISGDYYESVINPDGSVNIVKIDPLECPQEDKIEVESFQREVVLTGVDEAGKIVSLNGVVSPVVVTKIQANHDGVLFLVPVDQKQQAEDAKEVHFMALHGGDCFVFQEKSSTEDETV